jgi:hypothetical protein
VSSSIHRLSAHRKRTPPSLTLRRGEPTRFGAAAPLKVILEPLDRPPFDAQAWFARLDQLGGRDFLPDGLPDDPPVEPDPRAVFDE